jgi:hypothetical protein
MPDTLRTIKSPQHTPSFNAAGLLLKAFGGDKIIDVLEAKTRKQPPPTLMQRNLAKVPVVLLGVPLFLTGIWVLCNMLYGLGWLAARGGLVLSWIGSNLALGGVIVGTLAVSVALVYGFVFVSYRIGRWTLDHPVRYVVDEVEAIIRKVRARYGS